MRGVDQSVGIRVEAGETGRVGIIGVLSHRLEKARKGVWPRTPDASERVA